MQEKLSKGYKGAFIPALLWARVNVPLPPGLFASNSAKSGRKWTNSSSFEVLTKRYSFAIQGLLIPPKYKKLFCIEKGKVVGRANLGELPSIPHLVPEFASYSRFQNIGKNRQAAAARITPIKTIYPYNSTNITPIYMY